MELELRYFKCHDKYRVTISKGITLIKGPSGRGKSSIFEALTWLLYGTTRDIDPWTNNTAKTSVTLKYNGIKIVRSKRPNRLLLTTSEGTFEDAIAQDIIESTFKTKAIWECTGYIDEDAKNTFPYMTPKERLNTLMCLIYPTDNPEEEIEKIKASIEESKKEYEASEAIYSSYKRDYDEFWKINGDNIKYIEEQGIPKYTVKELKTTVEGLNRDLILLRETETRQRVSLERLEVIDEEIKKIEVLLSEETNIVALEEELSYSIKKEELEKSKHYLLDVEVNRFNEEDYTDTLEQERQYEKFKSMVKKHNIKDYSQEIEELRGKIRNSNTDFFPLLKRKEELKVRISIEKFPSDTHYTWEDVMKAKQYESAMGYNENILRDIAALNISISIEEMEQIVSNESNYVLLRKKRNLAKQLEDYDNIVPPEHTFEEKDYYDTLEKEKRREIINRYQLSKEHFDSFVEIESAYNVFIQHGDLPESFHTEQDLYNAQMLEDYYRVYGTKDYNYLLQCIAKARTYHKFIDHVALYETYGSKALSSITVTKQDLEKLKNELNEIEIRNEVLRCPHCDKEVYFKDHKLAKAGKSYTPQQIEELKKKYQEGLLYYEIGEKKKELSSFPSMGKITEYSSYKAFYKGEKYLEEPHYTSLVSDKVSKQLSFKLAYNSLSDKAKKYYPQCSQLYKHLLQLDRYYEEPEYSSKYIKKCLDDEKNYVKYQSIKTEYDSIDVPNLPDCKEDIVKVKKCLLLHRRLKDVPERPSESSINIEKTIRQEEEYLKYREAKDEYDSIVIPDITILSMRELNVLKDRLKDLESVSITEKPSYSSSYIRDSIEKTKILHELSLLLPSRSSHIIRKELTKQKTLRRQQDAAIIIKKNLEDEKRSIVIDDSIEVKIKEITENIESYENEIWATNLYNEYLVFKNKLNKVEEDRLVKITNYTKDEELLREAIDTVHQKLSILLSNINNCIDRMLKDTFVDPIEVRLKTFKQLKTKDVLRPEINLDISYRGGRINNIKKLSKGERHRIILAITLALNEVSKLPLLLIDETLAHIDQDLKECVTNSLKQYAKKKSLIIIAHDVIEGLYDNVIDL